MKEDGSFFQDFPMWETHRQKKTEISSPHWNFHLNYDGLDLKSHFILEPILVLIHCWARNSLKRTLQSRAWAPPSSLVPSLSLIPAIHLCRGLAFFSHGSPSWLLWQELAMYQCNGLFFQLLLKRTKDSWCVDGTSYFFFSFSAKKAYAFLPLAETYLYSQIACTDVFPVPAMTSSFSLLNLLPLRLPIQPSIFIHSFLPSCSR